MKRFSFTLISILLLTSCASQYQIKGTSSVSRLDGKMLFVKIPESNRLIDIDSAEVVHGLFSMTGEADSSMLAALYMDDQSIMPFVIEKGNISISIDNARTEIKGTPLNNKLSEFITKKISIDDRAYDLEHRENQMIMDGNDPMEIEATINEERKKLMDELTAMAKEFIQNNYTNILGPGIFTIICSGYDMPLMTPFVEEILKNAPESFKNSPLVKEYVDTARRNMNRMKQNMQSQTSGR
ncbi:MAG: DUF4369 domain-containing protein [Phocaeicola sp.]|uniref:DUF4369 domain-containing protein n=1 Tax=Phocaeicola sp. TaxID=2773926 RepID=UPI003F9F633D